MAERLGEVPAAAVPDRRQPAAGRQRRSSPRAPRARRARGPSSRRSRRSRSGAVRGPSGPASRHHRHRRVAGKEARISVTGAPSPRGTPRPANTGSIIGRPSSACQRSSAAWRPHQCRGSSGAAGGGGVGSKAWVTPGFLPVAAAPRTMWPAVAVVGVAQLVELLVVVQAVAGSSPVAHLSVAHDHGRGHHRRLRGRRTRGARPRCVDRRARSLRCGRTGRGVRRGVGGAGLGGLLAA